MTAAERRHELRRAQPRDAGPLAVLDRRINPDPWPFSRYLELCGDAAAPGYLVLVAGAGELAGFVVCSRVLDEANLQNVGVALHRRREGLAGALLDRACVLLREKGVRRCLLEVRASNHAAQALYASRGFRLDGRRENYYPCAAGREAALLLSKYL